jgi:DNA polymerase III subunit beta
MKLTITRENLLELLQLVINIIGRRQTMPILSNVLLVSDEQKLAITASDSEVELSGSIKLINPPEMAGATTVSGRKLTDICRSLPSESIITLESNARSLTIRTQNSHFNLLTLPANEFPLTQEQPEKVNFQIQQNIFLSLVKRTHFAIAENDPHYYLNGLLLDIKNGNILAVASDAHRMSLYSLQNKAAENITANVIIPKKAIIELMRLLKDSDEHATINIAKNYISVQTDNFILTSKLIDSKYPDYKKLIPKNGDKTIALNTETWKEALIRVGILSNEILRSMRLELSTNLLRMTAYNTEQEIAEEIMPIDYNGENLDIGFNITYLLDVLATIKTEKTLITFKNNKSGAIITEVDSSEDCLYVVMPFEV